VRRGGRVSLRALGAALLATAGAGCVHHDAVPPRLETESGIELLLVPSGEFTMGSPLDEAGREAQEVEHRVELSRPYYLGRYEVTQAQWQSVMQSNPSHYDDCPDCPVENVSRIDVEEFLRRLNASGTIRFRLPTEAEWEHACRAGRGTPFLSGDTLTAYDANFDDRDANGASRSGRYLGRTSPVGSYAPNAWGLHDMHGNVWEWTADRHCAYDGLAARDPVGRCDAELVVIRGGSWHFAADSARCALRYTHRPVDVGPSLGFRVAAGVAQPSGD